MSDVEEEELAAEPPSERMDDDTVVLDLREVAEALKEAGLDEPSVEPGFDWDAEAERAMAEERARLADEEKGMDDEDNDEEEGPRDYMAESVIADEDVPDHAEYTFTGHGGDPVYSVAFCPRMVKKESSEDCSSNVYSLISGGGDDRSQLWTFEEDPSSYSSSAVMTGMEDIESHSDSIELRKHEDSVISTTFSSDGSMAAISSMDGTISLFDCFNDDSLSPSKFRMKWFEDITDGPCDIELVRWHPKGLALLVGCRDTTVWLYSIKSRAEYSASLEEAEKDDNDDEDDGGEGPSTSSTSSPSKRSKKRKKKKRKRSKRGDQSGEDKKSRVRVIHVLSGHIGPVLCGDFTKKGKIAYTGSEDGSLMIWNCRDGSATHHLKGGKSSLFHVSAVTAADDQGSSSLLATGSADCQVVLTNYKSGKWLAILGESSRLWHNDGVECVKFCPQMSHRDYLCTGALDGLVKVWDMNRHDKPRVEFTNDGSVLTTRWFHHSPLIATGLMTGVVTIWDTRDASPVRRFSGHRAGIHDVDVSADDHYVVSSSDDGTCKVFSLRV